MTLVRLLGPVDVVDDTGTVHSPASALRRTLLALLALHASKVVTADWLMEHAWDGTPPESGLRALRFHISQLRKELGRADLIQTGSGSYSLAVPIECVDALAIESAIAAARRETDPNVAADLYADVLERWRGTPFVDAASCATLDNEAHRLAELQITLKEEHLRARLDCGAGRELIADLSRLTTEHPLREALWAMLITAQYRAGAQADALRTYELMRSQLAESLGLDPSTELQDLQRRVLQQDPTLLASSASTTAASTSMFNGPGRRLPPTKELIGRTSLIEDVTTRLDESRLITLVGPGGVGKTSIAIGVAAARSTKHTDGAWFVDLSRVPTGDLVVTAIGSAFGMHPGEHGVSLDDVVDLLLDKSLLMTVDNCEHVVEEVAIVADAIMSSCSEVHILATSREALGLLDEESVPVPPLDDDDALALLRRRASRVDGGSIPAEEEELAATLCRAVDRLPLGIELVAGRLRSMSMSDIVRQLDAGALLHVDAQRGANARHRSLYSTVEWSYRLLPDQDRTLLRRLAVFEGGASLGTIVEVCAETSAGQDEAVITQLLDNLVSTSLVAVERMDGRTRYRLLMTVRAFALDLLDEAELAETSERHLRAMIHWARRMRDISEGPDPAPAFKSIHMESADLRAAVEWCKRTGDHAPILELVASMGPFLARYSGAIAEIGEWVELALAVEPSDPSLRIEALLVAVFTSHRPLDVDLALASEARRLVSSTDDPRVISLTEYVSGDMHIDQGGESVEAALRTSIEVAEAAGLYPIAGAAVNSLANVLIRQLRHDEAADLLTPRLAESARYGYSEPFLRYHHARLAMYRGELDAAAAGFDASMRAAERCASVIGLSYVWFGKGLLAQERSDLAAARLCLERALVLDEQLGDRYEFLNDRVFLVETCLALGDLDAARAHDRVLGELATLDAGPRHVGIKEYSNGLMAVAQGRLEEARAHMRVALRSFAPTPMTDMFLRTLDRLAGDVSPRSAPRMKELADDLRDGRRSMPEVVEVVEGLLGE